ncbi:hypothetical protein [Desulfatiferula olefinivorans]
MKVGIILSVILTASSAYAKNSWKYGHVTHIQTLGSDGSFMVYMDNETVKAVCQYQRVYFRVSDMGVERTKLAYSMALSAYLSGKRWGVVIDLPTEIPDDYMQSCDASSTASQGAGITD